MKITIRYSILVLCMFCTVIVLFTGCASKNPMPPNHVQQQAQLQLPSDPGKKHMIDAYDPWEGFNRQMYVFNYYFDKYLFLPVVNGYAFCHA